MTKHIPNLRGKMLNSAAMRGRLGGGASTHTAVEAPDSIATLSYLRVIDLICEGPVKAVLKDGLQSLYLNNVPITNEPDGTQNILGLAAETRPGNPSQTPLTGFPDTETLINVNAQVRYGVPIITTAEDPLATKVRFAITIPALLYTDPDSGDTNGTSVDLSLDVQAAGSDWILNPITISGKTRGQQILTYEIALPPSTSGIWNLRVQRLTLDNILTNVANDTYFTAFVTLDEFLFQYNNRALCGIQVDSYAVGGQNPVRAFLGDWRIINIPSNYNSVTRTYSGIWDGTYIQDWTNNPVWVLNDIITDRRVGLGRYVGAFVPDKWNLYQIAQYCDELVPDGFGGTEPRYTFNGSVVNNVSTREDAMKVIQAVAGTFNGNVYWGANTVHIWADIPTDSSKLITPANIVGGKFSYSGTSAKAQHTVALVSWRNPANFYITEIEVVTNNAALYRLGWREINVTLPGITSRSLARRLGNWVLDTEQGAPGFPPETVTYTAGLDNADAVPGEVINIGDPTKRAFRGEGRLKSVTPNQVTLDAPFTFLTGVTYQLALTLADGTIFLGTVTNSPGKTDIVSFQETFPSGNLPLTGSVWVMRCSNAEPRQFRIISNKENDKHQFEITGLLYDPTKYARIEQGINFVAPSFTAFPSGPILPPSSIVVNESLVLAGGVTIRSLAEVAWSSSADPRVLQYEFQIGQDASGYGPGSILTSTSYSVYDISPGTYNIRVRSITALGQTSVWVTTVVTLLGQFEAPADVTNFNVSISGDTSSFTWDPSPTLNFDHFQIRYSTQETGVTWGGAQVIADNITSENIQLPTSSGTYLIKAVTTKSVESVDATAIVTDVDPGTLLNVVSTLVESPTFSGTKTNTVVESSDLRLSGLTTMHDWPSLALVARLSTSIGVVTYGKYLFSNYIDCGAVMTFKLTFDLRVSGEVQSYFLSQWATLHSVHDLDGGTLGGWSAVLSYRTTNDNPSGSPTWGPWLPLTTSDVQARAVEFMLELYSDDGFVSPSVSYLSATVSAPDRFESQTNVSSSGGAKVITFTNAFQTLGGVAVAGLNMTSGDYYTITSKSTTGFTIEFFNSSGTPITRNFDWIARGFGQIT